jgi:hypothetical protein
MAPEDLAQMKPADRHAPAILVRRFPKEGQVWLQHRDGEGGSFDAAAVAQVIQRGEDLEKWFWKQF